MPSYTIYNHRTEIDKIYTICGMAQLNIQHAHIYFVAKLQKPLSLSLVTTLYNRASEEGQKVIALG